MPLPLLCAMGLLFASGRLEGVDGVKLLGVEGQGSHEGVEDGFDLIALGLNLIGEKGLVLEGVEVNVAAVEGLVWQVVGVKFHQLNVDVGVVLIQYVLHGLPMVV